MGAIKTWTGKGRTKKFQKRLQIDVGPQAYLSRLGKEEKQSRDEMRLVGPLVGPKPENYLTSRTLPSDGGLPYATKIANACFGPITTFQSRRW